MLRRPDEAVQLGTDEERAATDLGGAKFAGLDGFVEKGAGNLPQSVGSATLKQHLSKSKVVLGMIASYCYGLLAVACPKWEPPFPEAGWLAEVHSASLFTLAEPVPLAVRTCLLLALEIITRQLLHLQKLEPS